MSASFPINPTKYDDFSKPNGQAYVQAIYHVGNDDKVVTDQDDKYLVLSVQVMNWTDGIL